MAARLLVFNPEHDYALACNKAFYSPPASVSRLASTLTLLPLIWGNDEDFILLPSGKIVNCSNPDEETEISAILPEIKNVVPWGWDKQLRQRLLTLGVNEEVLPGEDIINEMRRLSHRRISIVCHRTLHSPSVPREFFDLEAAMQFAANNPGCYFKLPWSSGGRGVVNTSELSENQIREWISGGLRRQISVLGEVGYNRCMDFASLWAISNGEPIFKGFSASCSDGRGKYKGNLYAAQPDLEVLIRQKIQVDLHELTENQRTFLKDYVAPSYEGPLGIDMLADYDGNVNPCVEINLRKTMGHVALEFASLPVPRQDFIRNLIPSLPLISLTSHLLSHPSSL